MDYALQEIFISIYQNYSRFNHDASEKTWITKITINKCKSYLRTVWFKRVLPISVTDKLHKQIKDRCNNFKKEIYIRM